MSNTTLLESCGFNEEELRAFGSIIVLNEGRMFQFGQSLWNNVKRTYNNVKDWTDEKIVSILRKMRIAYESFVEAARKKFPNVMTDRQFKKEMQAIRLLNTKRHIKLGVLVLTAIIKAAGGVLVSALAETEETVKQIKDVMSTLIEGDPKKAAEKLFGALDKLELATMIDLFQKFQKDMKGAAGVVAKSQSGAAGTDLELVEFELSEVFTKNMGIIK